MEKDSLVEVLVATYNGATYLEELIQSILTQTYSNIQLLIRDDGSKDGTQEIIQQLIKDYPEKIFLLSDTKQNLGIISNFSELIHHSKAPYVFLADQDDVWLPHKVETCVKLLKKMESEFGQSTPLLVHTDLRVVDQKLDEIHPSFWEYANLNPNYDTLNRLLVQNYIAGCAMGMNRALANILHPIAKDVMMHDWMIALVASSFGHIGHIKEPAILYRQHGGNTLGAQPFNWLKVFTVFFKDVSSVGDRPKTQAARLLEQYQDHLSVNQKQMIQAFIAMKQRSFLKQRQQIIKYGFYKHGFLRNIRTILRPFKY